MDKQNKVPTLKLLTYEWWKLINKNKDPRKPEPSVQGGRSRAVGAVRRLLWREMVFAGGREAGCLHLLRLPKQMPRRPKTMDADFLSSSGWRP